MNNRKRQFPYLQALIFTALLCLSGSFVRAQQPFVTDDADVTPRRKFHFEFSNEFDILQRSAFPSRNQNTAEFELDYGLFENVEIGFIAPLITIINDRNADLRRPTGIGDVSLALKYNFLKEKEGSRRPALAVALSFEIPTGDKGRQLGSGLADFYVNGVVQKSVTKKTTLRLNGGILFSGNESSGALGVRARGTVFTAGGSVVRQFTERLDLGFELVGAVARNTDLGKGRLQFMAGGNYSLTSKMTFDFGVIGGRYVGSPRAGVQVGLSVDF